MKRKRPVPNDGDGGPVPCVSQFLPVSVVPFCPLLSPLFHILELNKTQSMNRVEKSVESTVSRHRARCKGRKAHPSLFSGSNQEP